MSGLIFQDAQPANTVTPNRADVVCFIGFVGRRATAVPAAVKTWLQAQGWRPFDTPVDDADALLNVPVPAESFEAFDQLYAWEARPPQPHAFAFTTWLGAAVRSFFRQGGARCFIVRVGDPGAYAMAASNGTLSTDQLARLDQLFPGRSGGAQPSAADPSSWKGLGVLRGLADAAFVCFPDLPELVADTALAPAGLPPLPPAPEEFVPCTPEIALPADEVRQISSSPACTATGYGVWRQVAHFAARFLSEHRRDVQLVLALPLPSADLAANYTRELDAPTNVLGLGQSLDEVTGIATAFLQLCYPWLITAGAEALPGGLEPPDGVFSGALARSIPVNGVAHSVGRQELRGVFGFSPELPVGDLVLDTPKSASPALIHRVSLLGRTPDAVRVLSDVTTSLVEAQRPASVGRLTAAILRTAQHLGESVTFEPSGEVLWQSIRTQLERLMADFYAAGALSGGSAQEA